jgi:pimeloyl-ACP methyl ester carboxylesterase
MGADLPADFTRAEASGQRFVLSDSGSGPLVVLLHGFPDTPLGWGATARALNAAGYRTVVPYLRGYHPETIVPGRGYGGREIGEDAVRLLDALGVSDAVLVGHDWGAAIAFRAAASAPARVRALCAVAIPHPRMLKPSPSLAWGARHFLTLRLPTGPRLVRRNNFAYIDALIRRWAPAWSGPEREATLAEVKRAFSDPRVLDGALSYYRDASPGGAGELPQPALIVGGTTDIVPTDMFRRSPEGFAGACEVFIAEGAGHWPHREAADEFQRRLVAWLGTVAPGGA